MLDDKARTRFYAGIDPAKRNVGVAIIAVTEKSVDRKTTLVHTSQDVNGVQLLIELRSKVDSFVKKITGHLLLTASAIEGPSLYSVNRADDLGQVRGVLSLVLADYGLKIPEIIPPSSLKKFATGRGDAQKHTMVAMAVPNWGELTEDEADAAWLAEFAWALNEDRPLTRKQTEAVCGIRQEKKTHVTARIGGLNI